MAPLTDADADLLSELEEVLSLLAFPNATQYVVVVTLLLKVIYVLCVSKLGHQLDIFYPQHIANKRLLSSTALFWLLKYVAAVYIFILFWLIVITTNLFFFPSIKTKTHDYYV